MNKQLEIIEALKAHLIRVRKLEQRLATDLVKLPAGSLMQRADGRMFRVICKENRKTILRINPMDAHNTKLIKQLKYKRYIKNALPILQVWIKYTEQLLKHVSIYDPLTIQEKLKKQYHGLSGLPIFLDGDINPDEWIHESQPNMYEDNLIHPSEHGLMTRSKSEAQIASKYESLGWEFKYEPTVELPDGRILRPDFAILHPEKRKIIYHEHFGMMDDPAYALKAMKKLEDYASVGIFLGVNLVITIETKDKPFTFNDINELIKKITSL